jgi:alkanesulfonate monooxygenase SsuD/methylene tetrahydromethanopterin reductase-like flavin-dependent oxidoreductase (luciferase family)
MKVGIVLTPVHGPETAPAQHIAEHREAAVLAEQLGFSTVVVGQHFLGAELRFYQPIPYLTWLSTAVPSMEVATGIVLLSLVNPVDVAEQMATLDVLSGGKAIFGVGLGYSDHEMGAFGIERKTRVSRFEDSVALIRQLWSGKDVDFASKHFQVTTARPSVQPIQERLPIWIGGQSLPAVRRAGRIGDAWYAAPFCSHDELRELKRAFDEEYAAAGHTTPGEFPVRRDLVIASSRDQAREDAFHRSRARYQTYASWGLDKGADGKESSGFSQLDADEIDQRFILGTAEDCADQLRQLRADTGMTNFLYKPHWQGYPHLESMRQLEEFGTQVLPLLNG